MLTFEETRWNFKAIKIYAALNMLPVEIDMTTGKIKQQSNKIRVYMWKILFSLKIAHWLYIFMKLVQSVVEPEKYFQWHHFVIHFGFVVYIFVINCVHFHLFVIHPEETMMVFNQLFIQRENPVQKLIDEEIQVKMSRQKNKISQEESEKSLDLVRETNADPNPNPNPNKIRPLFKWPMEYSVHEHICRTYPIATLMTQVLDTVMLASDPTLVQLLYSSVPHEYQNPWSFFTLAAFETSIQSFIFATYFFCVSVQLLFFSKCQLEFQQMHLQLRNLKDKFQNRKDQDRDLKKEIWILRQIMDQLKELVVFIELFNRCFPFCIFSLKMFCLSVAILYYFFTIRLAHDFPFPAFFSFYIATLLTLTYAILYRHAFSIPQKMEEFKHEFLLTAQKSTSFDAWPEMKKEVQRIQNIGIKVGSFHTMERESIPNFLDFVVNQVVSLLVTFPR